MKKSNIKQYRIDFMKNFMITGDLKTVKDWNDRREKLKPQCTMEEISWLDSSGFMRELKLQDNPQKVWYQ